MGWYFIPFLLFLFHPSFSSSICHTNECEKASKYLLSFNDEKACTDTFAHSCTSDARKKKEEEEDALEEKLDKEDRRKLVEYLDSRKEDSNDVIMKGVRKLNDSCMNFDGSLFESISLDMDEMIKRMDLEYVAGFLSRGIPLFFKSKFVPVHNGIDPMLLFRNTDLAIVFQRILSSRLINATGTNIYDETFFTNYFRDQRDKMKTLDVISKDLTRRIYEFEEKFLKFKSVERDLQDYRIYPYDQFVTTFSARGWNMSKFLEGVAPRKSLENIRVEDPHGIHYAVSILAEMNRSDLLKIYMKEAYLHKLSYFYFLKRKVTDFPNPNVTESTKIDDCLSLVNRFFPFLLSDVKKNSTDPIFFDWAKQATAAAKKAFYRQIDESDWLEPFEKIIFLDVITKMEVFVYNDKKEDREEGALEYEALAKVMNSTDLLRNLREFEGSPTNLIYKIEDSAYTMINGREVFLQLSQKKSEVYNTTVQIGIARMINTLGHEIGHHLTDHLTSLVMGRSLSKRFLRHLINTLDCYRRVADEALQDSPLFNHLTEVNVQRVLREVASDIMGVQIGPEAYSYLDIKLLPRMKSIEEMYYRASISSQFFCKRREFEETLGFLSSTHPVQSQRIEYHRLFTKNAHFERAFNCTRNKSVCPNVF